MNSHRIVRSFDFHEVLCYSGLTNSTRSCTQLSAYKPGVSLAQLRALHTFGGLLRSAKRGIEISGKSTRINEAIRAKEIRLIDDAGKQLGIMNIQEALRMAEAKDVDLVEVSPNANPPVCRLMDHGKYVYERSKRDREARKAQKVVEVKEIRLRPKTGEHDIAFKMRKARQFLTDGSKVKVRVIFRGREITHPEVGRELLNRVVAELEDVGAVEQRPRAEGRSMIMILGPTAK